MRILQLTAHFSPNLGGVETHLDDLVKGLVERKHLVTVLTYQPLTSHLPAPRIESRHRVKIIRIPWFKGLFYKLVDKPILEFLYLFPGLFAGTFVLLFSQPFNVIHAHGLVAGTVAVFWGKIFDKRVVISTHSLYHFPRNGFYRTFVKAVLSQADKCLCLSKKSVEELKALGINSDKIQQFIYWINTDLFKPNRRTNLKRVLGLEKKFIVLFVGRLIEEKGVKILLHAFKKSKGNITLIIAGDGPLRDEVAIETQKNPNIRFAGKLFGEELVQYYNISDILLVPSIHDEGYGRVVLEALASGTPVIGSNRGSIPEALGPEVGRLIKITAPTLQKEIAYLKNHPDVLKKLKQNTRKYALRRFSEKNIQIIIDSYDK